MFNSPTKPKIGIPRTLFYYSYYPFCNKFFTSLGAEVITSKMTNKETIDAGINISSNELCIPIKVLYGHILYLKDNVDYIFLPYMISSSKGTYYCPKIIGTPDMVKANISGINLLSIDVDADNFYSSIFSSLTEISAKLSLNPLKIYSAYKDALEYQNKFDKYINHGILFEDVLKFIDLKDAKKRAIEIVDSEHKKDMLIAVIGHTYIINDPHMSFDIIKKLRERNVGVFSSDKLTESEIHSSIRNIEKKPHWSLGNRVLASAIYYSKEKRIDGIIYVTPFGCSSDSLIKEYIDANVKDAKPILTLTVDEHSSDAGMITRLEAFLDMIERRKESTKKNKREDDSDKQYINLSVNEILNELRED